jgi:hypothetical protein
MRGGAGWHRGRLRIGPPGQGHYCMRLRSMCWRWRYYAGVRSVWRRAAVLSAGRAQDLQSFVSGRRSVGSGPLSYRRRADPRKPVYARSGARAGGLVEDRQEREAHRVSDPARPEFLGWHAVYGRRCGRDDAHGDGSEAACAGRETHSVRGRRGGDYGCRSGSQVTIAFPAVVSGMERLFDQVAIMSSKSPRKRRPFWGRFMWRITRRGPKCC